jgi:putative hydrolase of HD superfamily
MWLLKLMDAMDEETSAKKIRFILEADKLKGIIRNTLLTDQSRLENAAEHSWHAALTALVFFDMAQAQDMDLTRILKMLMVHDLVEIDAGDVSCYEKDRRPAQLQKERQAAERIFNLLPEAQAYALRQLWEEFEARQTPEAWFAHAVDRLQPLLQAVRTRGRTWRQHNISRDQVIERMLPIRTVLPSLWSDVVEMIDETLP